MHDPLSPRRQARRRRGPRGRSRPSVAGIAAIALSLGFPWAGHGDEAAWVAAILAAHPRLDAQHAAQQAAETAAHAQAGLPQPALRASVSNIGLPLHAQPWISVAVEQPLPLGGQRAAAARALAARAAVGAFAAAEVRAGLALQARLAHTAWRDALRRAEVLAHHLDQAREVEAALVHATKAGRVQVAAALAQVRADAAALQAETAALRAARPALQAQTRALLGLAIDAPLPAVALPLPATTALCEGERAGLSPHYPATAGTTPPPDHPALAQAAAAMAAARASEAAARAALAPTLTPGFGVMSMPGMPVGVMVSLGVAMPDLPQQRDRNAAKLRGEAAGVRAAAAGREDRRRQLTATLAAAEGLVAVAQARLQALREVVWPARQQAIAIAASALAAGRGSAADALDQHHALWRLELDIVAAETAWLQARAAWLQRWSGGGDAAPAPSAWGAAPGAGAAGGDATAGAEGGGMGGHN